MSPPASSAKLDQLTSLRFFAALMIVYHHAEALMGMRDGHGVNWGQGVSFFFVLSGFILTYVYPKLETRAETGRFLRARFARIWPAHVAAFLIGAVLLSYHWDTATAVANLGLVHAWIPWSAYYFSYNGVSWSISTEAFFYVAFPLLIFRWERTWVWKSLGAAICLIALLLTIERLGLPEFGNPSSAEGYVATDHALVYIHPVTRIFEFVVGMVTATLWRRFRRPLPIARATALEIGAVLLCAINMWLHRPLDSLPASGPSTLNLWFAHSGALFSFAILIAVMANGGGLLSRLLSRPPLVLAGEISFSVYLLHQMLLAVLGRNLLQLSNVPTPAVWIGYFVVLLCVSYLVWACIEIPGRRLLLGGGVAHGSSTLRSAWAGKHLPGRGIALASVLVAVIVGTFGYAVMTHPGVVLSDQATADEITPARYRDHIDARFGTTVRLAGANIELEPERLRLELVWQKLGQPPGPLTVAVHFVDAEGNILAQADYAFPEGVPRLATGGYWADKVQFPRRKLGPEFVAVAIGVYNDAGTLLLTDHVLTDWDGRRLVLPVDPGAARDGT